MARHCVPSGGKAGTTVPVLLSVMSQSGSWL
jgi:hypothetical protein